MTRLMWDASALVKIYASELGSAAASALRDGVPRRAMATTFVGYAEAISVLVRKHNRREISTLSFQTAISALRNDILDRPAFQLLSVADEDFAAGTIHVLGQSLNATDAAILNVFLRVARVSATDGDECILITSDHRLLRAARRLQLNVFDPEKATSDELTALLAS